jgi:hypothetical protein
MTTIRTRITGLPIVTHTVLTVTLPNRLSPNWGLEVAEDGGASQIRATFPHAPRKRIDLRRIKMQQLDDKNRATNGAQARPLNAKLSESCLKAV